MSAQGLHLAKQHKTKNTPIKNESGIPGSWERAASGYNKEYNRLYFYDTKSLYSRYKDN